MLNDLRNNPVYFEIKGIVCALGNTLGEVEQNLIKGYSGVESEGAGRWFGRVKNVDVSRFDRVHDLLKVCLEGLAFESDFVQIGSSRGATTTLENEIINFYQTEKVAPRTSPLTTLGNIAAFVADKLGSNGVLIESSCTCTTGGQAFLNALVWLKSGLVEKPVVGAVEAALSPFNYEMFRSLKILKEASQNPCYPFSGQVGFVLGEAATIISLSKKASLNSKKIIGVGYAREAAEGLSGISDGGAALYKSMRMAVGENRNKVDLIIAHAPGTAKGDVAEKNAIQELFGARHPVVYSNKWQFGHTLAASGLINLVVGAILLNNEFRFPERGILNPSQLSFLTPKNILVNCVGFGGNAVSILIGV